MYTHIYIYIFIVYALPPCPVVGIGGLPAPKDLPAADLPDAPRAGAGHLEDLALRAGTGGPLKGSCKSSVPFEGLL